ncbi:hypothetical protein AAFN60_21235 [Roseibacillus persicicus]|uniref:hypothetical protein n=1 Tax=Roseibacillus persicicus TaxID=454148 RepID=UPI00398AFD06
MRIILTLLLTVVGCLGGMRKGPHSYAITSRDGDFVFVMNAGPEGLEHERGFGICYKVQAGGKFEEVWRTSGWWSQWIELSWDGKTLARVGCWSSGDQDEVEVGESLALALYRQGKLLKEYKVSDLVEDVDALYPTTAGYEWWGESELGEPKFRSWKDDFYLVTKEGVKNSFELSAGSRTITK